MADFEKKMDSKGYRILKTIADLFLVNIEFLFTVVISLSFLFYPALFALVEFCKKEKETYVRPFKDYFQLIRFHYSAGWKYWCVFTPIYAILGYSIYLSYQLIVSSDMSVLAWLSMIIVIGIVLVITSAIFHLSLFRAYFGDEEPLSGFRKASLVARKKIFITATIWVMLACTAFLYYLFLPLILIFGLGYVAFLIVSLADKTYSRLYREEQDRIKSEKEDDD